MESATLKAKNENQKKVDVIKSLVEKWTLMLKVTRDNEDHSKNEIRISSPRSYKNVNFL